VNCLSQNSDVKANSPWVFLFFIYSLFHTDFCHFIWDIITLACPILHRKLTLNLQRWVQPLLTSQDYKKLLLIVHSHCVTQCFPCCVSLSCVRLRLNMRSHCVTQCFACWVPLPCVNLRLNVRPALQCNQWFLNPVANVDVYDRNWMYKNGVNYSWGKCTWRSGN
jgi:hypothetical protein